MSAPDVKPPVLTVYGEQIIHFSVEKLGYITFYYHCFGHLVDVTYYTLYPNTPDVRVYSGLSAESQLKEICSMVEDDIDAYVQEQIDKYAGRT